MKADIGKIGQDLDWGGASEGELEEVGGRRDNTKNKTHFYILYLKYIYNIIKFVYIEEIELCHRGWLLSPKSHILSEYRYLFKL